MHTTDVDLQTPVRTLRPHTRIQERLLLAIFAGGMAGGLLRAGLEQAFPASGHGWPWATFCVNIGGTLVLAYFATLLQERLPPSTYARPFIGTGLCGALTTFSALQIEVIKLFRNDHEALGITYMATSVVVGLLAIHTATVLVRWRPAR